MTNPFPKLPEHVGVYRQAFEAAGHRDKQPDVAVACLMYVTDTATQVRQEMEASCMHYFQTVSAQGRMGGNDPASSYAYLSEVRRRQESVTWDEVEATMAITGSPAACIQKIKEAHSQCAMDQLICWFNPGGMVPHRQVLASMRRFAEEVMPALRHL